MFKKSVFILFLFALLSKGSAFAGLMPVDSVGVEKRNGKTFVVHKVAPKETLFALSRKYNVPVAQIVDANPKIQSGLNVNQLVYIPRKSATPVTATPAPAPVKTVPATTPDNTVPANPAPRTFVVDAKGNKMHQVAEKQTLFSIARLYQVSVADVKKWNKLTSDAVSVGDNLIVGVDNKTTNSPQYVPEVDDDVEKTKALPLPPKPTPKKVEETPVVVAKNEPATPVKTTSVPVKTNPDAADTKESEGISKVTEVGLAEVFEKSSENNKYTAQHKSAPIGTILQVKNLGNNQTVYVRVNGKLAAGANDKSIIKISRRAFQKLASSEERFRVEVSYMP